MVFSEPVKKERRSGIISLLLKFDVKGDGSDRVRDRLKWSKSTE